MRDLCTTDMMWITIACALKLLLHVASGQISEDDFRSKTECCLPKEKSIIHRPFTNKVCQNASWDLVNTTNGRFKVTIDLPGGGYADEYVAVLHLNENINSAEECEINRYIEDGQDDDSWPEHTNTKILNVNNWTNDNCTQICDKTGAFYFQFIFKGCYQLRILAFSSGVWKMKLKICLKYLDSGYQKQLLQEPGRKVSGAKPSSSPQSSAMTQFNTTEYPWKEIWLIPSMLTYDLRKNETNKWKSISKWTVSVWPDRRASCDIMIRDATTQLRPECNLDPNGMLVFSLAGVEPGDYMYEVMLSVDIDNRCSSSPLWWASKDCIWYFHQTVDSGQPKNSTYYEIQTKPRYLLICTSMLAGVFVVLIFTFVAYRYAMKIKPRTVPVHAPTTVTTIELRPAILLLYSRDCDEFMTLMVSFRKLLEQVTELEIYDCYDSNRWQEVSRDPSAWMQKLATSRDVRVIAVASQCASRRQRAQLNGTMMYFAAPRSEDILFPYGLQLLTNDVERIAAYQTTFVVRFSDFSDDDALFRVLNSYVRFVLPSHLDDLLCRLNQCGVDKINVSWLDSEEGQIFRNDLDNLLRYKQENPNYLQALLVEQNAADEEPGIALAVNA